MSEYRPRNEGEGSKSAARAYNRGAKEFKDRGGVDSAARDARDALEGPEGEEMRRAERAGKARAAEEDPELYDPPWWDREHDSAWARVKAAFQRDWEQTKHDLLRAGPDLDQGVSDTVKQAAGKEPIPPEGEPNEAGAEQMSFEQAEPALRYGYGAARYYDATDWDDELEARLRAEWTNINAGVHWYTARPLVYRGWQQAHYGA